MEKLKIDINNNILKNINSKKTGISQKDFMNGTYKITEPGYYILTEDIVFNPKCPFLKYKNSILDEDIDYEEEIDWLPTNEQRNENGEYKHSSFILGFYSAINIETNNVILDLNGFSIVEHPLHSLQQRFFQTIQLNNSPFISKQGPSKTFSDSGFISTQNIIIKNGYIGRTSHYCIHGNDNTNIILQDLVCENFEAGGIALNNVDNLIMENVQIKNSRTDIPVLASYSILRNTKITYNKCKKELLKNVKFRGQKSIDIFKRLLKIERRIINNYIMSEFKHIINPNVDDEIEREIKKYYYNKTGLSDASVLTGCQITP